MPAADLVVFGGGHLGAAVARHAATDRVLVASRTPRPHAGLWRAWDAESGPRLPLDGARVVFALGGPDGATLWPSTLPRLVLAAWRDGAASVTVCGPAGRGEPGLDAFERGLEGLGGAPRTTVVRFGALVGIDDGCLWPLVTAVRERGVAKLPRGLAPFAPLLLDDAARAVHRLADAGGTHTLLGPDRLSVEDLGARVVDRFGGRWTHALWGSPPYAARLRAWEALPDAWDDARLGPRTAIATWITRLPGLRRKR